MLRSHGQVTLIDIIGPDPDLKKFMKQSLHNMGLIINPLEKDGLTSQRNSAVCKIITGPLHRIGDLLRMGEMDGYHQGMVFFEHLYQSRSDSLGKGDRNPRADPEEFDMGDCPQAA